MLSSLIGYQASVWATQKVTSVLNLNPKVLKFENLHSQATIKKALQLAMHIHANQLRKDGSPYIEHPIDVASILNENIENAEQNLISAALLHDSIELGPPNAQDEITTRVNPEVASLVVSLSDDQSLTSDQRRAQQLFNAQNLSTNAKLIKLADRLSNIRQPRPDWNQDQRIKYVKHTYDLLTILEGTHPSLEKQIQNCFKQKAWHQ